MKSSTSIPDNALKNLELNSFNLIKIIYEKLTANVMLNGEILTLYYWIIKKREEKIFLKDSRQWSQGKGLNVRSPRNILKLIKTPALH